MSREKTEFASRMRIIREKSGSNIAGFARTLNVSAAYIGQLESGKKVNPSALFLSAIQEKLHINPAWLMTGSGDMYLKKEGENKCMIAVDDKQRAMVEMMQAFPEREAEILALVRGYLAHESIIPSKKEVRRPVDDDNEAKEGIILGPRMHPAVQGGFIRVNLLIQLSLPLTIILSAVGLGWVKGQTALELLSWLPYLYCFALPFAAVYQEKTNQYLMHRYCSVVRFKS